MLGYKISKKILALSVVVLPMLTSCLHDELAEPDPDVSETPSPFEGKTALNFVVTLDNMGGNDEKFNPMKKWENYIDPEKFRIFFFDSQERFLFESKSRWVKRQAEDENSTSWYVSVPFYKYGNDDTDKYNWDFDKIRGVLTSENFQVVLLVNRPLHEYASEYKKEEGGSDGGSRSGWFDNNYPDWGKEQSLFTDKGYNPDAKKIFDIHHSQEDPVYENKSSVSGHKGEGLYNFIMDEPVRRNYDASKGTDVNANTMLSSFKSWVDWEGEEQDVDNAQKPNYTMVNGNSSSVWKKIIHPSEQSPIPMYGTQKFTQIDPDSWTEGTTFELNRNEVVNGQKVLDLPVSLLRSCVKLELITPSQPEFVTIWYSNIYSRCEPMDIWTPTNEIWCEGTDDTKCNEMEAIMAYGPIYLDGGSNSGGDTTVSDFQKRLAWFYGSWLKKGWKFGTLGTNESNFKTNGSYDYPKVFNPMTQRNTTVAYGDNPYFKDESGKYHTIIYTGERNINDPSNLLKIAGSSASYNKGSGARTLIVLEFKLPNDGNKVYCVPITNYSGSNPAKNITPETAAYGAAIVRNSSLDTYANTVSVGSTNANYRPWPLMRNHVYRLYMSGTRGGEMQISSEHTYSKSITFPDAIKRKNPVGDKLEKPTASLDTSKIK